MALSPELPEPVLLESRLGALVDVGLPVEVTATRADVVRTWEKVLEPLTVRIVVTTCWVLDETGALVMMEV